MDLEEYAGYDALGLARLVERRELGARMSSTGEWVGALKRSIASLAES
jgi:hypothetical protein